MVHGGQPRGTRQTVGSRGKCREQLEKRQQERGLVLTESQLFAWRCAGHGSKVTSAVPKPVGTLDTRRSSDGCI